MAIPGLTPATAAAAANCAAAIRRGFDSGVSWNGTNPVNVVNGSSLPPARFQQRSGTLHTPYYEQWSLGIQQAIGDKSSLALGYVGNHGVHIPILNEGLNAYDDPVATPQPELASGALSRNRSLPGPLAFSSSTRVPVSPTTTD